ncbi:MAG TPA: glycosyltransferase family 1 protein [Anaeromyxobacteraceae bacterium]|nr:glycosyltransferase family 1 protein [Anaeromyxobacteraceae bacterium]
MNLGFDAKRAFHNATGLGNYSRDVLRLLHAHAPEHRLYGYDGREGPIAFDPGERFHVRRPSTALWRAFPAAWRQGGMVRDLRRDGIALFHGLSGELPLGLGSSGIAGVVTVHDLIFERHPELYPLADRWIFRWKARSAARRADLVVAASEQTRRDLVEIYAVPEEKIRVVYQGCGDAFRSPVPEERLEEVARAWSLPPRFVLSVGTIERRKNLLLAVKAVEGIPGLSLVAVGRPTAYAREVEGYVASRGLLGRVRMLRDVPQGDLAAMYRLARALVYPSLFEGFGIPIVEALVSGTPVVTTRGGCFAEVGGPGSAYVDPTDPEELREALAGILADPARREAMRVAGLAHAARFAGPEIARALLAVYAEAVGRRARAPGRGFG